MLTLKNTGSSDEKHPSMHIFADLLTAASVVPPEILVAVLAFLPHPESSALAVVRKTVP